MAASLKPDEFVFAPNLVEMPFGKRDRANGVFHGNDHADRHSIDLAQFNQGRDSLPRSVLLKGDEFLEPALNGILCKVKGRHNRGPILAVTCDDSWLELRIKHKNTIIYS